MAEITATLVKELRIATNVSMMECKKALVEADGDMDKAIILLRERGMAVAAKKAARTANQGIIASATTEDDKITSLVEINCETDFVTRNQIFQAFVRELAARACATDGNLADEVQDELTRKIAEIGENIVARRNVRFVLKDVGKVASYIHMGGKVGVLVELGCEKPETTKTEQFKELLKDLTLHVAAANPGYLTSTDVPETKITAERDIYAKQVDGNKPPQIVQKIVDGKIKKFFAEVCLVDQGFVKEPKQSIAALLSEKSKQLGDTLSIRRFVRYQLGV
ncbi:MAG: translation elongation factor Ts [Lentisphaerae bacterium]|nr:translation elongation factor Ts [Lentisphaerota bacterium]